MQKPHTDCYVHTFSHVCSHGKMVSMQATLWSASSQNHSLLTWFAPSCIFEAQSQHLGWLSPGLKELYPLLLRKHQSGGSGSLAGSCWQPHSQVTLWFRTEMCLPLYGYAGSGCFVNGRLPGIIIMQAHYKGRCKSCTSENAKHFLYQEVFH